MSQVKVLGVPSSAGSREETALVSDQKNGPAAIRSALKSTMDGFDIPCPFVDMGDLSFEETVPSMLQAVEHAVYTVVSGGDIPAVLGGVHTLTLGSLRAIKRAIGDFSLIYFDAHPDLMPREDINYGSSLYHAHKEGLVKASRMALLGVRQIERPEREVMEQNSMCVLHPLDFESLGSKGVVQALRDRMPPPYFLSIDIDAIDISFAPGVSTPFAGGLTVREVQFVARELVKLGTVGFELVELAPINDDRQHTALQAAILLHTISEAAVRYR